MPSILALDTSTEMCSAALLLADGRAIRRFANAPREHTQLLLNMVDELLAEAAIGLADLDAIAFGRGPGSFTGIRIAVSMAQGLAFAVDKPLIPVSTLAAIAQGALESITDKLIPAFIIPAIDARMSEIYWAVYQPDENGLVNLCGDENLDKPEAIALESLITGEQTTNIWGIGTGWQYAAQIPLSRSLSYQDANYLPDAIHIARLAQRDFASGLAVPADQALPVYLRDKVAWQNG